MLTQWVSLRKQIKLFPALGLRAFLGYKIEPPRGHEPNQRKQFKICTLAESVYIYLIYMNIYISIHYVEPRSVSDIKNDIHRSCLKGFIPVCLCNCPAPREKINVVKLITRR